MDLTSLGGWAEKWQMKFNDQYWSFDQYWRPPKNNIFGRKEKFGNKFVFVIIKLKNYFLAGISRYTGGRVQA